MRTLKFYLIKRLMHLYALVFISLGFMACEKESLNSVMPLNSADLSVNAANLVKVTSTGLNFDAPDEIPSGWTTFKYMNKTQGVHFFALEKLPDGKTIESSLNEVLPPFQAGMDYYRIGDFEQAFGLNGFGGLPTWFFEVKFTGGPGLIDPGKSAISTVYLEPGTYVIECYVKSPDGRFHSVKGMIDQIIVSDENSGKREPKADVDIVINSETGITLQDEIRRPGNHTFSVFFENQAVYGNLLGHDVHLVKFNSGFNETDKAILNNWMNWLFVDFANTSAISEGMLAPAPAGISFLGGTQELPEGQTAYFNSVLTPGDYALIAEVDDPMGRNLYAEFSIK